MWELIKIPVLFHKSAHPTLPIWLKRIFGKFLNFPEKLTLCPKFEQKWFCWDFEVLPPDFVRINQNFSPIPQIQTPNTNNLTKNNFWKVSQFSRKTYIVCKIWTKMVLLGFWSLPPDFVTINQNFSPIPQIYTPSTTILTLKNFWKVSQFSRKTYIVCKIWTNMVLVRISRVNPLIIWQSIKISVYSTNLHLQHYHSDHKEFLENFPIFQKNLHCLPIWYKIDSQFHIQLNIQFHIQRLNLLQDYLLLFGNFTPIPQICTHRATNLAKNIFEEISQFSRKTYIVRKIWQKMVLLRFWSLTPWFCDN